MTQKNIKSRTMSYPVDKHDKHRVSVVVTVIIGAFKHVNVGTYLMFHGKHINTTKRRGRVRSVDPHSKPCGKPPRRYRTKTEDRHLGTGAFNILEKHREDMEGVEDSLTTEFITDLIAGFKREQ